jgi:hypothetical protein
MCVCVRVRPCHRMVSIFFYFFQFMDWAMRSVRLRITKLIYEDL